MSAYWIALRIVQEIWRDRRTVAFILLVPLVVMTLVYYAVSEDEKGKLGVISRGTARLFEGDLMRALEDAKDVRLVALDIPDDEADPAVIERRIYEILRRRQADGVLFLDEKLLLDRFDGKRGNLNLYVEGSRPTITALVLKAIADAMDDLTAALPVVIDASCSAACANSVNNKAMHLEKHYVYGSEDYRTIDFFLPVFPPFFVFFFTFILATVTFQRERLRGTLERLLIAPVGLPQVVLGYVGGFFLFCGVQAVVILAFVLALVGFPVSPTQVGSIAAVTALMLVIALLLGLTLSFTAQSEFQAVQFIPLVILPQVFLSDMIWDINAFPWPFQWISWVLPLTHANVVMRDVLLKGQPLWQSWQPLLTLTGFGLFVLAALALITRRKHTLGGAE
jgi:ABC-2 type transport system permease protein